MTDVTDFVFERLELLASRVEVLEAQGNTEDAEFLRAYGRQFADECGQEDFEFITISAGS